MPSFADVLQVELERALEPVIRRLERLERCHCQTDADLRRSSAPAEPADAETAS